MKTLVGCIISSICFVPMYLQADSWLVIQQDLDTSGHSPSHIQAENLIELSDLDSASSAEITQTAQLNKNLYQSTDNTIQAVNAVITDNSQIAATIKQTAHVNGSSLQLIQNGAQNSIQAINYVGKK